MPWLGWWAEDSRPIALQVDNGDENSVDLLITSNKRDAKVSELYRCHGATGAVAPWLTDQRGNLAGRARKEATQWVYENALPGDTWQQTFTVSLKDMVDPLEVSADPGSAWALSNHGRDKVALVKLNLSSGREKVFYSDPRLDLSQAFISRKTGEPMAVVVDPSAQEWKFYDSRLRMLADKIKGPLTSRIDVLSIGRNENRLVVVVQDSGGRRQLLVEASTQ